MKEIPKFLLWTGIAIFVLLILYSFYNLISYKFFKPYQKYLEIECYKTKERSYVILTAKENLKDIRILNLEGKVLYVLDYLEKESMDIAKINLTDSFIKVKFIIGNKTIQAVIECKEKKKSLIDLFK